MKRISVFFVAVFVAASCTTDEYGYIEKAEIIDKNTIYIYFPDKHQNLIQRMIYKYW
jgi:hypothetical protein